MYYPMLAFIDKFYVLTACQFDFRNRHITEVATMHALHYILRSLN